MLANFCSKWLAVWDHILVEPTQDGKCWLLLSRARNLKMSTTICSARKPDGILYALGQVSCLKGLVLTGTNFQTTPRCKTHVSDCGTEDWGGSSSFPFCEFNLSLPHKGAAMQGRCCYPSSEIIMNYLSWAWSSLIRIYFLHFFMCLYAFEVIFRGQQVNVWNWRIITIRERNLAVDVSQVVLQ